jgi:ComEC/Rec2-related protein
MTKYFSQKNVILLSLLIVISIVIKLCFLQQFQITQKVSLTGLKTISVGPVTRFVSSRGEQFLPIYRYYTLFIRSKYIIFSSSARGISAFSNDLGWSDNRIFSLDMPTNQLFLHIHAWWSSDKCWFPCREAWWHQRRKIVIAQQQLLLGDQVGGLVAAVTLGSTESLDSDMRDVFAFLGLQHLLAPSGYHLGIFLVVLSSFLPAQFPRGQRLLLSIFSSGYLIVLTGFRPSLIRAWCMWLLTVFGSQVLKRPQPAILRLGGVVLILFFLWPDGVGSLSFQLSIAATLGILLYAPLVLSQQNFFLRTELGNINFQQGSLRRWRARFLEYLRGTIVIGCIAQLAVAPLVLEQFGSLQVFSPVTTLAIAWLLPVLLLFGLVIVLLSPLISLSPPLFVALFAPVRLVLDSVWSAETSILVWLTSVVPPQLVWRTVPTWFSLVWWGFFLGLRFLWWLGRERIRVSKRNLI